MVPNTKGGVLLDILAVLEPSIARRLGYTIKLAEKAGLQVARLFDRVFVGNKCERNDCYVCMHGGDKKTRCMWTNMMYEALCVTCLESGDGDNDKNKCMVKYIGESSRCLSERSKEHIEGLLHGDDKNFVIKHRADKHIDMNEPPVIKFIVIKITETP